MSEGVSATQNPFQIADKIKCSLPHSLHLFASSLSHSPLQSASPMATVSAAFASLKPPSWSNKPNGLISKVRLVSFGAPKLNFPSLRSSHLRVSCLAKPETVNKVLDIVKRQLALSDDTNLIPGSKFSELGADSLDTVEIVMCLEEEFGISVDEDNSQNINTVQEAADLIEKLVQQKSEVAS